MIENDYGLIDEAGMSPLKPTRETGVASAFVPLIVPVAPLKTEPFAKLSLARGAAFVGSAEAKMQIVKTKNALVNLLVTIFFMFIIDRLPSGRSPRVSKGGTLHLYNPPLLTRGLPLLIFF